MVTPSCTSGDQTRAVYRGQGFELPILLKLRKSTFALKRSALDFCLGGQLQSRVLSSSLLDRRESCYGTVKFSSPPNGVGKGMGATLPSWICGVWGLRGYLAHQK